MDQAHRVRETELNKEILVLKELGKRKADLLGQSYNWNASQFEENKSVSCRMIGTDNEVILKKKIKMFEVS